VKRLLLLLAGALLMLGGLQLSAEAATVPLGNIAPGTTAQGFGGATGFATHPPINDQVTFTLTAPSTISGNLLNTPMSFTNPITHHVFVVFNATDLAATLDGTIALTLDSSGNFSYAGVLSGSHFIQVTGLTTGINGGAYALSVTATAATPIPGTMSLFLTALGGTGGLLAFRRRALPLA